MTKIQKGSSVIVGTLQKDRNLCFVNLCSIINCIGYNIYLKLGKIFQLYKYTVYIKKIGVTSNFELGFSLFFSIKTKNKCIQYFMKINIK